MYGVDLSSYCVKKALKKFRRKIAADKINIVLGTVNNLPYPTNTFDSAFHVNCYFFWNNMPLACRELIRVMKPRAKLVTTMDLATYHKMKNGLLLEGITVDPINYIFHLEEAGFQDINVQYLSYDGAEYPAIIATASDYPQDMDPIR